jgi:hypothetical protein
MTAFQLAVDEPACVKSLTVVNSGPAMVLTNARDRRAFLLRRLIVRFLGMRKMGAILADMLLPEPHQKDLHNTLIARWAENDRRAYLASMKAITGWSVADRLGRCVAPAGLSRRTRTIRPFHSRRLTPGGFPVRNSP